MTWHEDDSFWEHFQSRIFAADRQRAAAQDIEWIIALAGLRPGARILDLPCGIGIHSLQLASRGFAITGVDRTARYLDIARAAARPLGLQVQWVRADMRTFVTAPVFDAVLNLFTSFGYFEDPEDQNRTLRCFFAALKPGGSLIMEMMGREVLCRVFRERDWQTLDDGTLLLEERNVARDWTWMDNRWISVRDGRQRELRFGHHLYSGQQLADLLRAAGFARVEVFGSLAGAPYDHEAQRLVVRAIKG